MVSLQVCGHKKESKIGHMGLQDMQLVFLTLSYLSYCHVYITSFPQSITSFPQSKLLSCIHYLISSVKIIVDDSDLTRHWYFVVQGSHFNLRGSLIHWYFVVQGESF